MEVSRLKRWLAAMLLCLTLAGCGGPLGLLTGGGPNVAANVQAGKSNTQAITATVLEQKLEAPAAQTVHQTGTVKNTTTDPYVLALLMLFAGFVIPSPSEIARYVRALFSTKSDKGAYHG
jgi:predicted small lipoprotein YifL